jgi:hypothetical protein
MRSISGLNVTMLSAIQQSRYWKRNNLITSFSNKVWGSGCIDPLFLDLGTTWRWSSFTPRPLYTRGESPSHPLDKRLEKPRAGLGDVQERKFLTSPGLELRTLGRPASSQSLYRLRESGSWLSFYYMI